MNKPQRIIGAVIVPALLFISFCFLELHVGYRRIVDARDIWWAWIILILIVGAFEWLWWADGGRWAKCRELWRQIRPESQHTKS